MTETPYADRSARQVDHSSPAAPAARSDATSPPAPARQRRRPAPDPSAAASSARFSSDNRDAASIIQQQRNCRRAAEANRHQLAVEGEFVDHAISGTRANRAGFQALLRAAREGRFGVLYVDNLSRLARELVISLPALRELTQGCGVRVLSVSKNIDSAGPHWEVQAFFSSWMHQGYLKTLAANVRRGQEDAALDDRSVGDLCFGYRSEPIPGSEVGRSVRVPRKRLVVDPDQAVWVVTVFELFVRDRLSMAEIARRLTAAGVAGGPKQLGPHWYHATVRTMLGNSKYVGRWGWGRTRVRRILAAPAWRACVFAETAAAREAAERGRPVERTRLEAARTESARRIARLVDMVEAGETGPELRTRLAERRTELADLDRQLWALPGAAASPRPTAEWVDARLAGLQTVLAAGGPAAALAVRALIGPVVVTEERPAGWMQASQGRPVPGAWAGRPATGLPGGERRGDRLSQYAESVILRATLVL